MKPFESISKLVQTIKSSSTRWINFESKLKGKFCWQSGYAAFSYSKSQIDNVVNYINKQKEHHRAKHFKDEYTDLLNKFGIDYDERYLFKPVD